MAKYLKNRATPIHVKGIRREYKLREEVVLLNCFHDILKILNSLDLPLNGYLIIFVIIRCNLLINYVGHRCNFLFIFKNRMIFKLLESDSVFRV